MTQKIPSFTKIRKAVETRDAKTLKGLYANNAVLTVIDTSHPPSRPLMITGAADIGAYLEDVYSRDMTHKLESGFIDDKHLAFVEGCSYPDGTHVIASAMADFGANGITRQTIVQAWDS